MPTAEDCPLSANAGRIYDPVAFATTIEARHLRRARPGRGFGFKDADSIVAEANVMVKNAVEISIDNSPHLEGVTNIFRDNLVAYNDVGVSLLPSVRGNRFQGNQFLDNVQPVSVSGGGSALANEMNGLATSGRNTPGSTATATESETRRSCTTGCPMTSWPNIRPFSGSASVWPSPPSTP